MKDRDVIIILAGFIALWIYGYNQTKKDHEKQ